MTATSLPEIMTYWRPVSNDGFGGKSWSPGVEAPARHANRVEEMRTAEGKVFTSSKVFYSETVLGLGDYVALGQFADTPSPDQVEAREVMVVTHTPSMSTLARMVV